jgi:hypothetical protein
MAEPDGLLCQPCRQRIDAESRARDPAFLRKELATARQTIATLAGCLSWVRGLCEDGVPECRAAILDRIDETLETLEATNPGEAGKAGE